MKKCPNCNNEVGDNTMFCNNCGIPLKDAIESQKGVKKKFCVECGSELIENSNICPQCGCIINVDNKKSKKFLKKKIGKKGIILLMVATLAAVIIISVTYNINVAIPKKIYEEAYELYINEEYGKARDELKTIPDYKDTEALDKKIINDVIEQSEKYVDENNYDKAIEILDVISDYPEIKGLHEKISAQKEDNTYNEIIAMLDEGKYQEALSLINSITQNEEINLLKEQMVYETYTYSAARAIRDILKNPNSLIFEEVNFYERTDGGKYPNCVIYYGAQNGFGGIGNNYSYLTRDNEDSEYKWVGSCDSLDYSDYDDDEWDKALIAGIINSNMENPVIGAVDVRRTEKLIESGAYRDIEIIELDILA